MKSTHPTRLPSSEIERRTHEIGRQLLQEVHEKKPSVLNRQWWEDKMLDWTMGDEAMKVQTFRFVDVLPMLKTSKAVNEHLKEYFGKVADRFPWPGRRALEWFDPKGWYSDWFAEFTKANAGVQAQRFIAGTNAEQVIQAAERERGERRCFTLDVLGEAVISEKESQSYLDAYSHLIEEIAPKANAWREIPQLDRMGEREIPRVNLSIKLSALDHHFDPIDPDGVYRRVYPKLEKLFTLAREHHGFINFDMETYETKDLTHSVFKRFLTETSFRDFADVGIVIQCYLRDSLQDLEKLHYWAKERGTPVWVRLVKGAYWDYETVHAKQMGWPIPVYQEKWQSDANFEECTRYIFSAFPDLYTALGSHNLRSLSYGIATAEQLGLAKDQYEIQMLYGMAEIEKASFVEMGHRMRVYMPYGELIPGMAYLVRRLLENTSNDSFLKASYTETKPAEELLMNPTQLSNPTQRTIQGNGAPQQSSPQREFQNEPHTDFSVEENRQRIHQAIQDVTKQFDHYYPLVVNGEEIKSEDTIISLNPSHKAQRVGTVAAASVEQIDQAVQAAKEAYRDWSKRPAGERAEFLRKIAQRMRQRKAELVAWINAETAKGWRSADGDVAEAIDFCEYYALQAEYLEQADAMSVPGESNRLRYRGRGVAGIIAPWNFPLAILTGMTAAALVTGNTVLMKPAEQSSVIGAKLMEICREVGLPPGVLHFVPGRGEVAGARMVEHPDVALISFTGSRAVGLGIHLKAAELSTQPNMRQVKKVIAEMGGKNAIIVDDDADLDEAVAGVVESAFGYQGQKCSACSRVIVLKDIYDAFLERLVEAVHSLKVGPAEDPGTQVGPVIDEEAMMKIRRYIQIARNEATELVSIMVPDLASEGFYIGPHVFSDVDPHATIAQEEIFGPVLAVTKAESFEQALQIANDTDYGLTGGIFSRSPAHLERVAEELEVGNIYLNRGITGSLVARQPFGGHKMSGIGAKAGGPDYLLQFVVPRVITENTMRRGFAPTGESE